jgi:hypothetical protein
MWTQHAVFFKGDVGTKVKTPGSRKKKSRRALQDPTMEKLCKFHHFSVQGPCLVSNTYMSCRLLIPNPKVTFQKAT